MSLHCPSGCPLTGRIGKGWGPLCCPLELHDGEVGPPEEVMLFGGWQGPLSYLG